MSIPQQELDRLNAEIGRDAAKLVAWALSPERCPVVSTSFGPFAAVTLHMATQRNPHVPVLWVDAGYGTPAQYQFADELTAKLNLNLKIYRPRRSKAHREAIDGPLPGLE